MLPRAYLNDIYDAIHFLDLLFGPSTLVPLRLHGGQCMASSIMHPEYICMLHCYTYYVFLPLRK